MYYFPALHRGTVVLGVILTLIGAWYVSQATTFPRGTMAQPGPGVYSILLGCLIVVTAVGTSVEGGLALKGGRDVEVQWPAVDGWLRIAGLLAGAATYLLLLGQIGHLLASFAACLVIIRAQGYASWPKAVLWAAGTAAATYLVFVKVLAIPFFGNSLLG